MKRIICATIAMLALSALIGACGGGGGGGFIPPPPPPPPAAQSPGGLWAAPFITMTAADVVTGFETVAGANFSIGTAPYTATFAGGDAGTRGVPGFYADGVNSWHIPTNGNIFFETPAITLSYHRRTVTNGDVATIVFRDADGNVIGNPDIPPDAAMPPLFSIDTAGGPPIASVEVTVTTGEIVIDLLTFGYAGFVETTGTIFCIVDERDEFACGIDDGSGVVASAEGTLQITNGNEVSGSGTLHAVPGLTLGNGSTVADLSITAGTVSEGASLDFSLAAAGGTATVALIPDMDEDYSLGSDVMANVAAVYTSFDLFGDNSSFVVSDAGAISGDSDLSCALTGQVSIIDVAFNTYDVALDLAGCTGGSAGLNGMYNGLGFTAQDVDPNDVFIFAVFDADGTVLGEATK